METGVKVTVTTAKKRRRKDKWKSLQAEFIRRESCSFLAVCSRYVEHKKSTRCLPACQRECSEMMQTPQSSYCIFLKHAVAYFNSSLVFFFKYLYFFLFKGTVWHFDKDVFSAMVRVR